MGKRKGEEKSSKKEMISKPLLKILAPLNPPKKPLGERFQVKKEGGGKKTRWMEEYTVHP